MRRLFAIVLTFLSLESVAESLYAQNAPLQKRDRYEEDLFFTYAGAFASGGISKVAHTGWIDGYEQTKKSTGYYGGGGFLLDVYVREIIGEFKCGFFYNGSSDPAVKVSHAYYSATAKYLFRTTPFLNLTAGLGIYFEGAPANKSYSGAGGEGTVGCIFNLPQWDMKLSIDGSLRYGFFGQDAKSTKFDTGMTFGITRKVGRS